ncbi:MAG: phospholipase D-like domain-containing protein [Acidimicrobiales bacterium]
MFPDTHKHGAVRFPRWPTACVAAAATLAACGGTSPSATTTSAHPVTSLPAAPGRPAPAGTTEADGSIGPVIVEPDDGMGPIYRFMRSATTSLTMTMYELVDPTAEAILGADAARGARVRVLLDSALENARNQPASVYLEGHGVSVAFAPSSRITHQKTICVNDDGCLVMSLNLVASDYASTRDVAVEDSDPDDVAAIEKTFAGDTSEGTAVPAVGGAHLLWSPGSEPGIVGVIDRARHSLMIENEEMASPAVTDALGAAARRGVDVEMCMTADPSDGDALRRIASAGAHVRLYPDRSGLLYIHEKLIVADAGLSSAKAVVGSINFSTSSLDDNRELDLVLDEHDARAPIATLGAAFGRDFAGAAPLAPSD